MAQPFVSERDGRVLMFSQQTGRCVVVDAADRELLALLVHKGLLDGAAPAVSREAPSSPAEGLSTVYLHLTNRCNLTCAYCYNAAYRHEQDRRDELTTAECRRCLEEIAGEGGTHVVFTGGEPLLRADAVDLAQHARGLGLETTLLTNGTGVSGSAARIANVFDSVIVSLDSWQRDEHDRVRGRGSFDRVVRGIKALVAERTSAVHLRAVVTKANVESLPQLPRYAASNLGCTNFMLAACLPANPTDRAAMELTPAPQQYVAALDAFHRALEEVGGASNYEREPFRSDGSCGAGRNVVSIAPNGDVFPCQCLHLRHLCAGNLRTLSLRRILLTAAARPIECQATADSGRCAACPVSSLCGLRCWAVRYAFRESEEALIDHVCPIARAEIESRLWGQILFLARLASDGGTCAESAPHSSKEDIRARNKI